MFLLPISSFEIRQTKNKGRGVFARLDISGGTVIGDYLGIIKHPREIGEEKDGLYEMYLADDASALPNKNDEGIHLVNYSCTPNCRMYPYKGHVLYYADRKIFNGEELTVDYMIGDSVGEAEPCLHICHCGSRLCRGTMHSGSRVDHLWEKLCDRDRKLHGSQKYVYDSPLLTLEVYPQSIPDEPLFDLYSNLDMSAVLYADAGKLSVAKLREKIRESGRGLQISLQHTVYGLVSGSLLCNLDFKMYKPEEIL